MVELGEEQRVVLLQDIEPHVPHAHDTLSTGDVYIRVPSH